MQKFKVGVVGVGKLGSMHCNALRFVEEAELVGVFDTNPETAQKVAEKHHVNAFNSLEELLHSIQAVIIVVPTVDHYSVVMKALDLDIPVFVEKPIASNVAQAKELVERARQRDLTFQVGHIERFNPAIRALHGMELRPMFIESHRLAPFDPRGTDVAVVLDLMIHDIDIILSLVKSKVRQIDANGIAVVSDAVDIANARVKFENGCVANVTASRISQRKMRKMRLFQRDTYISIDFLLRMAEVFRLVDSDDAPKGGPEESTVILGQIEKGTKKRQIIYDQPEVPSEDAMQSELKNFIRCVTEGKQPLVSGEDGLHALEVASEITNIIKQNI